MLYILADFIEDRKKVFFTFHERPQLESEIGSIISDRNNYNQIAIVMQGPLLQENDFTFETLKLYKKLFKGVLLILSTWEEEDAVYLERIQQLNVVIVKNKKPDFAGPSNINFQLKTSFSGIMKAKEMGMCYALKTRTDQRIYSENALHIFKNLMQTFTLKKAGSQKQRLIVSSFATLKYRLYGITDMLMFGEIDDMVLYWSADYDNRVINQEIEMTINEFSEMRTCEIYLCTEFLKKTGQQLQWTLADSWKMYADHFCIFDHSSIDLFWYKYGRRNEYRYKFYYPHSLQLFNFNDWLNVFNENVETADESILQKKFGGKISAT